MSTSSKPRWARVGAAALAVALTFIPVQAVTVRPARGGGLYWAAPAQAGTAFVLTWTHTVSRRPVTETYRVESDRRLCLQEMVFDHEGPNLPSAPEGSTVWRIENGKVHVTNYDLCLDRLNLGVAPFSHQLAVGARTWNMLAGVGPDRLVVLRAETEPWIMLMFTEVRQWLNGSRS